MSVSLGRSASLALFLAAFTYSSYFTTFPKLPTLPLILVEIAILAFCELGPLSNFGARKLCHSFSGFMMLHLDPADPLARYFVYAVAISSLAMVWEVARPVGVTYRFRYAKTSDVGISIYLVIVSVFFHQQLPLEMIKPVFFSDPLGALVGRFLTDLAWFPNPTWAGEKKTVCGSCAVFLSTVATLSYGAWWQKLALSCLVTLAEATTREFDNLCIAAVVIGGYWIVGK